MPPDRRPPLDLHQLAPDLVNRLLVALRQQRLTSIACWRLRIPVEDEQRQHRGTRGFYGPNAVS